MKIQIALIILSVLVASCTQEVSDEKRGLVDSINKIVDDIDGNHRVEIYEDDFHAGDSVYKIRGYFMDQKMLKLVGVLYCSEGERDDYFYFKDGEPIFTGHVVVKKKENLASEYRYYYEKGELSESLFWEDHYQRGKQFPHEKFKEFNPNRDSLVEAEKSRLDFFLSKLNKEGFEVMHENENLGAN